jgi:hypothetical protein
MKSENKFAFDVSIVQFPAEKSKILCNVFLRAISFYDSSHRKVAQGTKGSNAGRLLVAYAIGAAEYRLERLTVREKMPSNVACRL